MKNVRKSKMELMGPKKSMKFLMYVISSFLGFWMYSWSTLSVGMVTSEISYSMLLRSICVGSIGTKGKNKDAPAALNMFPKFELIPMRTYFIVFPKVFLPSRAPALSTVRSFCSSIMSADSFATSRARNNDNEK